MAKKKRKKPYRPPAGPAEPTERRTTTKTAPGISPASAARRDRKEDARRQREAALRQMRRQAMVRRLVTYSLVAAVVAGGVAFFLIRNQQREDLSREAGDVAAAAGCTGIEDQTDRGQNHVSAPEPIEYPDQPPTSGTHRPNWLDPAVSVYEVQPDVAQAVHNLEHAYVVMWYRAEGEEALDQSVIDELAGFAEGTGKTIIAPYGSLPDGVSVAFTGWATLQTCPADLDDPDDARILAEAFSQVGRSKAPEPTAP